MIPNKNRLIVIVSLLLITGFLATSLASHYVARLALRKQISNSELPLTSDNVYSEIQRDLLSCVFISSLMATDTFVRDWLLAGEQNPQQITNYLNEIQKRYNTFTSFLVSGQSEKYYHSSGVLKTVRPGEERDAWYFRVKSLKTDYEINLDPDMANKDAMTIFVNYRIYDYAGKFIGVTGVGLTITAVKKLIEKYQENYGREIFFVDMKGNLTLHGPDFQEDVHTLLNEGQLPTLVKKILRVRNGRFSADAASGLTHFNVRHIPELDWILVVGQSEAGAMGSIHNALAVNMVIFALITVIVLILTNVTISIYQKRLEEAASTDKLTGIHNRQAFDILIEQAVKEAQRRDSPLSLIMLDIDRFKETNDSFGHLAGDAVLRNIVKTMERNIRKSDALGRWGGEEFLVLLQDCALDDAFLIAEKIRTAVNNSVITHGQIGISTTVSLGVAQRQDCESQTSLLNRADMALYKAKNAGRNRTKAHRGEPLDCLLELPHEPLSGPNAAGH